MAYAVILSVEAVRDLRRLDAHRRAEVKHRIELHLRHEPTKVSRSRIKRLHGLQQPQYRLRVGDIRVYYDVTPAEVQVLGIVAKSDSQSWLEEAGIADEEGSPQ